MNLGPNTKENKREVNVARIALVERNSTTRKGPKNSDKYSNKGSNFILLVYQLLNPFLLI